MAEKRYRNVRQQQDPLAMLERLESLKQASGPSGMRDTLKSYMRANPELSEPFDYESLGERFPVKSIQSQIAAEDAMELRAADLEYRKSLMEERISELGLKKAARDLDLYESRIAKEDAMLEQVPLARQELGALDPRSPDYLQQRMGVINKYPVAFEYAPFVETVDKPLLFRHGRLKEARVEAGEEVTEDAFNRASLLLSDSQLKKRVENQDPIATMQAKVAYDTVNKFMAQRGFGAPPAEPTGMVPEMETAEPEVYEFNSLEEADSSGLPVGTIIYINGRKAIIE
jgi:hypothetical protein